MSFDKYVITEVPEECADFESVSVEGTRFWTQMMKVVRSFEMPGNVHRKTQNNISKDWNLQALPDITKFEGPV